jgi:hypothetical protein
MARPEHTPTDETRDQVLRGVIAGVDQDRIAAILGIAPKTLRKHYRDELDHGKAKANMAVGGSLYQKAIGGDTTAAIFWAKTQMGWRETQNVNQTNVDIDLSTLDDDELDRIAAGEDPVRVVASRKG